MLVNSIFAKNTNSLRVENPIGDPFYELRDVDSTNNYAMRQVQAHLAEHGATWFAWYQNAGKGQRGKPWDAETGKNIIMSTVFNPHFISLDNQFLLNAAVALACFDFFNFYAIDQTYIKWPNDIYWRDRKAGGILIENVIQGKKWKYAIAGIGININQTLFPTHLPNPVSLKQIAGKTFEVVELSKHLCQFLEMRWQQLRLKKYDELLSQYCSHLYKLNEMVTFKTDNLTFTAIIKGVNRQGELMIQTTEDRAESTLAFGSVKWLLS